MMMRMNMAVKIVVAGALLSSVTIAGAVEVPKIAEDDGCMACHRIDGKYLGPSFRDIADRYRESPDATNYLIQKVTEGGFGGWGRMPMPPSDPKYVTPADVKALVKFILSIPPKK
ncbi:MAG: c-type cytochrome [Nitrosomonadales bacterium]|nr:c-type cytochrome [Nitrosomonadales bacterium]